MKNVINQLGMSERFSEVVYGYADTLHIIKKALPERKKAKESFKEEELVKFFLPEENISELHNAINDITTLQKLIAKIGISDDDILKQTKSLKEYEVEKANKKTLEKNKTGLLCLKTLVPAKTLNKFAKHGINAKELIDEYKKNGYEGIKRICTCSVNNKVRISSSKKVIKKIVDAIEKVVATIK